MRKAFIFMAVFLLATLSFGQEQSKEAKNILFVSAERSGVFKTGGLAIAVDGLARAIAKTGINVDVILPYYTHFNNLTKTEESHIQPTHKEFTIGLDVENGYAHRKESFSLHTLKSNNTRTLFLKHQPHPGAQDYFDNPLIVSKNEEGVEQKKANYGRVEMQGEAFGAWSKATAEYILSQNYDIVILNDWHTGLVAIFLDMAKQQGRPVPKVITAIHNIAFQGENWRHMLFTLGIPERYYDMHTGIEWHGKINYLKAALQFSDHVYTVSKQYAFETLTEMFGSGLQGIIKKLTDNFQMAGILNGITRSEWDPSKIEGERKHDLKWKFSEQDFSGKAKGKYALQVELGLIPDSRDVKTPLFVLTSRIAEQKGFEYLVDAIDKFLETQNAQVVIIGDGDKVYLAKLNRLQEKYSQQVRVHKFTESLERKLITYGDFFINAAWFEPSGLNQFFAMMCGTIPVLSQVGGLANSIKHEVTGYFFKIAFKLDMTKEGLKYLKDKTAEALTEALIKVTHDYNYNPEKITKMRIKDMQIDNSWDRRVTEFLKLFKYILNDGHIHASRISKTIALSPEELLEKANMTPPQPAKYHNQYNTLRCEGIFH